MNIKKNFININNTIRLLSSNTKLVVVTKNQTLGSLQSILDEGHLHFGENRIKEADTKWSEYKKKNPNIILHFIGHIQSNIVSTLFTNFLYIHSLDREKLAIKFSQEEKKKNKALKYFIQVNVANETQKSGIKLEDASSFINFCINELKLDIKGLMCIPPLNSRPEKYFIRLLELNKIHNLTELSMGMSYDYKIAIKHGATFVRIGSAIFNKD